MKLSDVIAELEREAARAERASKGGALTTYLEDFAEGEIATAVREVIAKLKTVTEL
jgi:hypothetical protein